MASAVKTAFEPAAPDEPAAAVPARERRDGTVEVSHLWPILRHRRGWILGTALLLTAATLAYGLLTPSLYTATAQILVDPRDRQVVSNDINPSTVAPDGGVTQVESQVSVVQSTGVLLRAIAATDLTSDPEFNGAGGLGARLAGLFGRRAAVSSTADREAKTLDGLRRLLTVKRADKVLVIDVSVTARDPDKTARLANAIAAAYLADQASARAAAADAASDALTARLAEQRRRVRDAEDAVERYRTQNNIVVASGQLVSERQLADANDQLSAVQSRLANLKSKVDQIQQQRRGGISPDSTAEAIQSPVVSKLREQESALVQRQADLESQLGPRHPSIAAVAMELRRVHQLIGTELGRVAKAVQSDYDRTLANERSLATRLDTLKGQTLTNDQASIRLQELQRERDAVRSVYGNYLVRVQETREQANIDSTNARVISQALVPQARSWPPLGLLLAGALGGGLGIGAAMALVAEYAWPTVLSAGQAQDITGAPVIGVLPGGAPSRRRWPGSRRTAGVDAAGQPTLTPHMQDIVLLALRRLFGMDPARRDRTAVRSVFLTSGAADAADRDRVAQLLAATASMQGERVLFVDADVAHNQQTSTAGLLDVLRGECSLESVVHFDPGGRLAMLNKGRQLAAVGERVERVFAARMLTEARHQFDLVVIDGGEVTENLRTAPLVTAVQEVVFVGKLSSTAQDDVVAATDTMRIAGRQFTGVLLVDALARA